MTNFTDLGLSKQTLAAVQTLGYTEPTPVQAQAIPLVLSGRDTIAAAKTGTGKTAAFALPAMQLIERGKRNSGPRMLVISPTRELADQIADVARTIATSTKHRVLSVVGGVGIEPQINALKNGIDVLIATPGRLIDLMERDAVRFSDVSILVLDEADRMLDMGFWPQVKRIVNACPSKRQTLLFSATIDDRVEKSAKTLLCNPAYVQVAHHGETADTVEQFTIEATQAIKPALLKAILEEKGADRVIVFVRTRHRADACARRLRRAGYNVEALHSDRTQAQRKRALESFSAGQVHILVATDVLARGIDVTEVDYVVNYDIPNVAEDYIHRIGRTGRAGMQGFAISLVSPDQKDWLRDIEKLIGYSSPALAIKNINLADAERVAAERALKATSVHDPELTAAAAELAKKQKKKAKKAAQATEQNMAAMKGAKSSKASAGSSKANTRSSKAGTKPSKASAKTSKVAVTSSKASAKASKATTKTTAQVSTKARAKAAPSSSKNAQSTHATRPSDAPTQKRKTTAGSKPDLRPGRAHRAAIARQRQQ